MTSAHILLAHGSRDPEWGAAIEAVAARIRRIDPAARVGCAYLEGAPPDLLTALDALLAGNEQDAEHTPVSTIRVWPMFLGLGRHARADLPRLIGDAQQHLRARHPGVALALEPTIAEHAPVLDAMARVILHKASNF